MHEALFKTVTNVSFDLKSVCRGGFEMRGDQSEGHGAFG